MDTLSYGYKKPRNPDTGDIFFPALEADIQQLNDHAHDGVNSAPLASKTQSILAAGWALEAGLAGIYSQTIQIPNGFSWDTCEAWFKLSTGETVFAGTSRVDATHYKIYTTDNTQTYTAFYR